MDYLRSWRLPLALSSVALFCCALSLIGCDDDEVQDEATSQQAEAAQEDDDSEDDADSSGEADDGLEDEGTGGVDDPHGVDEEIVEAFREVVTEVRFEPYRGVLRGAIGAEGSGSANAADQALLLGEKLESEGYEIRYARGTLTGDELSAVVESMYPSAALEARDEWKADEAFEPESEDDLRDAARDHLWVELKWDDEWLGLDPVFPGAAVGEANADRDEHFETPPESLFQEVEFKAYAETAGGETQELGSLRATTAELAEEPPLLVVRPIPLIEEEAEAGSQAEAQAMDALGGLSGGSSSGDEAGADDEEPAGHSYQRHFKVGDELKELEPTVVEDDDPDTALRREWIEIRSTAPGADDVVIERDLHPGQWSSDEISQVERRHALTVVSGPVDAAALAEATAEVDFDADEGEERLDELTDRADDADDDEAEELIAELAEFGDATAQAAGHLTGLRFAATSDELGRGVISSTGAARVWARPRVLITTFGTGDDVAPRMSLDLRMNAVDIYPPPGAPARLAADLQATRGKLDAHIEHELLRQTSDQSEAISTVALMSSVHDNDIDVHVLVSSEAEWLDDVEGLPDHSRRHIDEALSRDRHVIIPDEAVELAGAERWGWWELDPDGGELLAVMDSGQHQVATEYTVTLDIGLNEATATALGMTTGATATMFGATTVMLRHWELNEELIDEIAELLEGVMCSACFSGAGASGSLEISAKATGSAGCMEKSISRAAGGGMEAGVKLEYCEHYRQGFECMSSTILDALRGTSPEDLVDVDVEFGADADAGFDVNC